MRTVCKSCGYDWWDGPDGCRCPSCGSPAIPENRYRDDVLIVLVPTVVLCKHGQSNQVHLRTVGSIWASRYHRDAGAVLCHQRADAMLVDVMQRRPTCNACLGKWHYLENEGFEVVRRP